MLFTLSDAKSTGSPSCLLQGTHVIKVTGCDGGSFQCSICLCSALFSSSFSSQLPVPLTRRPTPRKRVTTFHRLLSNSPDGMHSPACNIPYISSHSQCVSFPDQAQTNIPTTHQPSLYPTPAFTPCFPQRELSSCVIPLLSPRMPFLLFTLNSG